MQRHGESTPALAQAVQKVTVIVFAEKTGSAVVSALYDMHRDAASVCGTIDKFTDSERERYWDLIPVL